MGRSNPCRRARRRVRSHLFVHVALAATISSLAAAPLQAAAWQGREVNQAGVPHVLNPAEPSEGPVTIAPEEIWRIGGDTDAEGKFFGVIGEIEADDDGTLYLLDVQLAEVKLFGSDGGRWPLTEDDVEGNLMVWAAKNAGDHIVVERTTMTIDGTGGVRTVSSDSPRRTRTSQGRWRWSAIGSTETWRSPGTDGRSYVGSP